MDVFPSLNFKMNSININDEPGDIPGSLDSITLGQLKSMVGQQPKLKTQQYAMRYEDEDTVFDEIEEFYSYAEIRHVSGNLNAWQSSFHGGEHNAHTPPGIVTHGQSVLEWLKTSPAQRKSHVEVLLESLEHRDTEIRFTNARKLLYLLQGNHDSSTQSVVSLICAPLRDVCRDYVSRASSPHDH
jgi:hypothetical protein